MTNVCSDVDVLKFSGTLSKPETVLINLFSVNELIASNCIFSDVEAN